MAVATVLVAVVASEAAAGRVGAIEPVCPSTLETNSSIPKGDSFQWFSGEGPATSPEACVAACCSNSTCANWAHTTWWSEHGPCAMGQPCCVLYAGTTHPVNRLKNSNTTSGQASPWGLRVAGVFTDNMVLQREPASASVFGLAPPGQTVRVTIGAADTAIDPVEAVAAIDGEWKARFPPQPAGGSCTVTVTCPGCANQSDTTTIHNVTFGDVWVCSGQSNAWLPMHHTFGVNESLAAIAAGAFDGPLGPRIRMFNVIQPGEAPTTPMWVAPIGTTSGKGMAGLPNVWNGPNPSRPVNRTYGNCDNNVFAPFCFSALCWNFGVALLNKTEPDVPLGLISSVVGGTPIQAWSEREQLLANCRNVSAPGQDTSYFGGLYNGMIAPLVNMSVKGFVWYQGENSIGRLPEGSTTNRTGYACAASNLVKTWRAAFSAAPNSTDPAAPFGVVTLAAGTSEGHQSEMAAFRQAQLGAYQHAPNPAMRGVFAAAAHDLGDPCYRGANCSGTQWAQVYAHSYMGPIHPRIKQQPADRLATAAAALYWSKPVASSGPVFSGCSVSGTDLTLRFNATLLGGDTLSLKPYNRAGNNSATEVQFNMTGVAHSGRPIWSLAWVPVNISLVPGTPGAIMADLSSLEGAKPLAVRYAWGDTPCCRHEMSLGLPCLPANCPLFGEPTNLPAMPFTATITDGGECLCQAPNVCGAN